MHKAKVAEFRVPQKLVMRQGFEHKKFIWRVISENTGEGEDSDSGKGRESAWGTVKLPVWAAGAPFHSVEHVPRCILLKGQGGTHPSLVEGFS